MPIRESAAGVKLSETWYNPLCSIPSQVVYQAKIRQERRIPGGLWMLLQKTGETGEIIRVEVFRVSQKCGGEGGIFGRRGFGSDRHQRLFENPRKENILRCRIRGEMERGLDDWNGLAHGVRSPIRASHSLNPANFMTV